MSDEVKKKIFEANLMMVNSEKEIDEEIILSLLSESKKINSLKINHNILKKKVKRMKKS